jgi:hypothetical protein
MVILLEMVFAFGRAWRPIGIGRTRPTGFGMKRTTDALARL